MLIAVEGLIGASKSTNSQALVEAGVCDKYIPEPVQDNPYLEEYYAFPKETSFKMQVFLLNARYKSFQNAEDVIFDLCAYNFVQCYVVMFTMCCN